MQITLVFALGSTCLSVQISGYLFWKCGHVVCTIRRLTQSSNFVNGVQLETILSLLPLSVLDFEVRLMSVGLQAGTCIKKGHPLF